MGDAQRRKKSKLSGNLPEAPEIMQTAIARNKALVKEVLGCGSEDSAAILDTVSDLGLIVHETRHTDILHGKTDRVEKIVFAMEEAMMKSVENPTVTELAVAAYTLLKLSFRNVNEAAKAVAN